jgi:1-deoxy-D-xylulose-5-phosphate reductoisomerase
MKLVILGSTGWIGRAALDVVERQNQAAERDASIPRIEVVAIAAKRDSNLLHTQAERLGQVPYVAFDNGGMEAILEVSRRDCDMVLNAICGSIGLEPSLAALQAGRVLALANKETLVAGGTLVQPYLKQILPVDSEHSALWQGLRGENIEDVAKLVLTASGGPFFGYSPEQLAEVSVEQALRHPTWAMSQNITLNSANLVNKALELAEAHYLFNVPAQNIEVLIHRQSVNHSMVEFRDGSLIAQMAPPDMRVPIALAFNSGRRIWPVVDSFDLTSHTLDYFEVDNQAFPAIELMRECMGSGPLYPCVYNAANEILVEKFANREIGFGEIVQTIARVLERCDFNQQDPSLSEVRAAEDWARSQATHLSSTHALSPSLVP